MAEERLPRIETVADLAAFGRALERALARKYEALAERMDHRGRKATAALFRRLAETDRGGTGVVEEEAEPHGVLPAPDDEAVERLLRLAGDSRARGTRDDAERDLWAEDPYLSTPYRALGYAVRNTERAFRLYSYLASAAAVPEVRAAAESRATAEIAQARRLRAERRRAYHAERAAGPRAELPPPGLVEGRADLLAVAAAVEARIAAMLKEGAVRVPALGPLARTREALARRLDGERAAARRPRPAIEKALGTWLATNGRERTAAGNDTAAGGVSARLYATAERAFAFYDGVFARAPDEDVMLEAQALCRAALELIAALSGQAGNRDAPG